MVLRICKYGEKVLREKAQPVVCVTDDLRRLADDMVETMHQAKGVGLAAEQVGRLERLCVIDIPEGCEDEADELFNAPIPMPLKLFNPEIVASEGEQGGSEGCLSVPGKRGYVVRPEKVTVKAQDRKGKPFEVNAEGLYARALCHEIDHLDGRLYIDIMDHEITDEEQEEEEQN